MPGHIRVKQVGDSFVMEGADLEGMAYLRRQDRLKTLKQHIIDAIKSGMVVLCCPGCPQITQEDIDSK